MTELYRCAEPTPPRPILDMAREASARITALCETRDDCAHEVEGRGGKRSARVNLPSIIDAAVSTLLEMALDGRIPLAMRVEFGDMAEGCRAGYVRESWALRVMRMAAEVARG